ncbi:MAG: ATP-dependent Clp protease proteolytic subunit [Treponema sp.]|nr:ATP-dependent Clp protease proteolytic subunit [Treponema sp.]
MYMYRFEDENCECDSECEKKKAEESDGMNEKFFKTRQIILSGEINDEMAQDIVRQLFTMEAENNEPIRIFIDSPGGSVDSGFAIFDTIRFINCPVYTIGMGLVASAAALILLAAPKENRFAFPNSHYLLHQPLLSGMRGTATEIEIQAAEIEKTKTRLNELISEETGKAIKQVEKDTDRDFWLGAKEALEYGLVSKVLTKRSEL